MALLKTNTGIGTTNPTSALHVIGDGLFTGVVTATSFNGSINAGVGTFTNLTATNATLTNINSSGISTLGVTSVTRLTAESINSSGIVTGSTFRPSTGYIQAADGTNSLYIYSGTGNVAFQGTIGASQINNAQGYKVIGFSGINDATFENNVYISGISTLGIASATTLFVSGVSTISVNSSSDALRITQLGSGNALVVEDSANPDSTPFVVTGAGKVGIGKSLPSERLHIYDPSGYTITLLEGGNFSSVQLNQPQSDSSGFDLELANSYGNHYLRAYNRTNTEIDYIFYYQSSNKQLSFQAGGYDVIKAYGDGSGFTRAVVIGDGQNGSLTRTGTADQNLQVKEGAYIGGNLGVGVTNPTSKLQVQGDVFVSGVVTATTFIGALTGIAASATQLVTPRTFEITGDVVASPIFFDGTGNVSLAATIQPNSVGLGTDTTGDYVRDITGTSNQITVTGGTGEGSTPTLSIPNQFVVPQDLTVTRDVQIDRNLNVNGNITIGGSSATLFSQELKIFDPDIVLGFRTDAFGNDVSNDNTANHGGVAVASTEGTPLVQLFIAGIETNPATYKKIMWFKAGEFAGLGTDAWLFNYAVGIGSTQFPSGTRLAAGAVQFTENDLAVVRDINASGIITAASFSGNASSATNADYINISVETSNDSTYYIPFESGIGYTSLYTDTALTYNPGQDLLGLTNIQGTKISLYEGINASGIITATTFNGQVNAGVGTITSLIGTNLNYGGVSTLGNVNANQLNVSGIITGTLANNLTLNTSGTGLSGSATYNNSGVTTFTVTSNATNVNTPNTIVARDASGNFSAGTINANLVGIASTATQLLTPRDFSITGDFVTASAISFDGTGNVALAATITPNSIELGTYTSGNYVASITNGNYITGGDGGTESAALTIGVAATSANTANQVVARDASGNFSAGTITANLTGTATTASFATTSYYLTDANNIISGTINVARLTGTYDIDINGNATTADYADIAGIATNVIGGIASVTQLNVSGVTTISVNTSTDALRITQTGSGNALVVEDETNPDATPFVVTSTGGVGIGTTNPNFSLVVRDLSNNNYSTDIGGLFVRIANNDSTDNSNPVLTFKRSRNIADYDFGRVLANIQHIDVSDSVVASIDFVKDSSTGNGILLSPGSGSPGMQFDANNKTLFSSTGNVGIGTTNPTSRLYVVGDTLITGITTTNNLNVTGDGTFLSSGLKIRNPANTFQYNITGGAITADRTLNLPVITTTDTVATLGLSQTFTGSNTFNSTLTANSQFSANGTLNLSGGSTGTHVFGTNQSTSTLTFGGTSGTGTITLGRATTSQTLNIQAGVTASGNTKTINFGTGGASGSFTQINVGPTAGVGTVAINSGTNLGIGTTNPGSTLTVQGNAYITGVTTSTDFDSLSDINLKTNINQIADPLEKVMQIRGVTFDWKETNRGSAGVIAQEIEKVLPELVHGGETKTVNYNGLIGLLIECVKKQQEEIEQLKKLN